VIPLKMTKVTRLTKPRTIGEFYHIGRIGVPSAARFSSTGDDSHRQEGQKHSLMIHSKQ